MINNEEKITREVNEVLIDRIRKYQSQDVSQLINSPNDEETNNSYLGGLINFVGDETNNINDEINNDLDKITINEIFLEPQPDNEYISDATNEEEEEESESQHPKNVKKENRIKIDIDKKEDNVSKEEKSFINPFLTKKDASSEGIRVLLSENYNNYLDLIGEKYEKYDCNHFPKIIVNDKNNTKKVILNNLKNKVYYSKEGEKIIVDDDIYDKSLAYLNNKEIYGNIPARFKKKNSEFTLDFNLLDESIENIQMKSFEFIEINKLVSTSISKITLYCTQLSQYVKDKLEPFNDSINSSYDKIINEKKIITEIKNKTIKNSGDIILKKIKMNNSIKLLDKFKKYINIKEIMNNLESLITEPKNYQKTFDLINKCKEEIDKIKNEIKFEAKLANDLKDNKKHLERKISHELKDKKQKKEKAKNKEVEIELNDPIINLFEKRLNELRNENNTQMSGEFSQVLNNYFNNFLVLESENEVNFDKKEKMAEFEKYNFSNFVLEKVSSFSDKHNSMLISLYFPSPKEELEKIDIICDYYIQSNLIYKVYNQLKGIFRALSEKVMNNILSLFNDKFMIDQENDDFEGNESGALLETGGQSKKEERKDFGSEIKNEKENESNTINGNDDNDQICILLCVLLSKNKLIETMNSFIEVLLKKIENSEKIDNTNKEKILKEIEEIKIAVNNNIKSILLNQIQKCLHIISSSNNIDLYINNFYLVLEMLQNEIPKFAIEKNNAQEENKENLDNQNENNNDNNNDNNNIIDNNELGKIIIDEQKYFIENWQKYHLSKFDSEIFKSWEIIKEIPSRYQNILNVFFTFDINKNCMKDELIITKFPSDKIKMIKDAEEEEEENTDNNSLSDTKENLLYIKEGENPEIKLKINQISLEIIKFTFELLKMFCIFHKYCYGFILEKFRIMIISHLEFQKEQIFKGKCEFTVSQQEISMTNGIFLLIEYIYEHFKKSDFFVTIADNSEAKIYEDYLDLNQNIKECLNLSKKKVEDLIDNHCIKETLDKLHEIKLPYYNVISGDAVVNDYVFHYASSLKNIYDSMINCYEDKFIKEMIKKALNNFFDEFENYVIHGKKIEDENCLRQFKKDMILLRKNLGFITIIDLTDVKNRIEKINKSVLPESMRTNKKK